MIADTTREEIIFLAALKMETAEERLAYAESACHDCPELQKRVVELLKSHEVSCFDAEWFTPHHPDLHPY